MLGLFIAAKRRVVGGHVADTSPSNLNTGQDGNSSVVSKTSAGSNPPFDLPPHIVDGPTGIELALIPAGSFQRLECFPNAEPAGTGFIRQRVVISKPFYIGVYEVTQAQWKRIMGKNSSYRRDPAEPEHFDSYPVETLFTFQVKDFLDRTNFRLPREVEWEYASRGGLSEEIPEEAMDNFAYTKHNSMGFTHPVGQLNPNGFGLYDMFGNVAEMCAEWYSPELSIDCDSEVVDPVGRTFRWWLSAEEHVVRGGSYFDDPSVCKPSGRMRRNQEDECVDLGFRVARSP
jgi:formylglycine-generating enzyme required for sulfatase activity